MTSVSPAVVLHPFLQHEGPIPIVHRGGPVDHPENTMAAFEDAYRLGFRYFETDVHATADDVLVACHDPSLHRLAGDRRPIRQLTLTQLRTLRIDGEPVPLLADLLHSFPDVRINIDPKSDDAVRPLVQALRGSDVLARVCCASFSDRRLRYLRTALGPRLCSAAGPREIIAARWSAQRGRLPRLPSANVLQIPTGPRVLRLLTPQLISLCHEVGLPVQVWTINDRTSIQSVLDLGVDGVMSDDPMLLREIFRQRGHWPT